MTIQEADKIMKKGNSLCFNEEVVLFDNYELFNYKTRESKQYNNIEEVVENNPDIKEMILETKAFLLRFHDDDPFRELNDGTFR